MLKIRPFEWKDVEALCERNNDPDVVNSLVTTPPSTLEGTLNYFSERLNNQDLVLIAEEDGKIAGSLEIRTSRGKDSHVGRIGLALKKEFWGRGMGTKLLKEAIKEAGKRRLEKLVYYVSGYNERSINLAKDLKFSLVGRLKKNIKVGKKYYDMLIFEKLL